MKLAIAAILLLAVQCQSADIRVVGGREVDLQPIHDWQKSPEGERPLRHWKKIKLITYMGQVASYSKYEVNVEGVGVTTNMLANVPPNILEKFKRAAREKVRLQRWLEDTKREQRRVKEADAVAPTHASGSSAYVNSAMAERERVNLDAEKLRQSIEDLKAATEQYTALLDELDRYSDYGMFTGQNYAGMAIMDLGHRK